jgi:predicted small lipoprotein YifL
MNHEKLLGLLVLALFLVIVLGCGRKAPPSLPQKPSSSVRMTSKELRHASDSFHVIIPHNGCNAGFSPRVMVIIQGGQIDERYA